MTRHWGRAPLLRPASGSDGFDDILTLADIDRILTERGLRFPALRVVRDGETVAPDRYTKSARLQSRTVSDFIDPGRVLSLFADGSTIVLQALHRYWEPLAHFCRELELDLTHPVQVNVYVTPPSSRGLDVHYDTHDVFVLQVSGVKHWKVWGSAVDLPLAHQRRKGKYEEPGTPRIDVELKPGDALYIPRGFLHAAETAASESSHMTVGILAYTWMDVVKAALERASGEVFLREALPPGFAESPAQMSAHASSKLSELVHWLQGLDPTTVIEDISGRFWSSRPPVLSGLLQQVLDADDIDDETVVRRRHGAVGRYSIKGEDLTLTLGDRVLAMPARLQDAVQLVLERSELRVVDLEPWLDAAARRTFVRRLIVEGLLEQNGGG